MSGVRTVFLRDICNFTKGSTGLMKAVAGEYPLVATGADRRTCESFQFDTKAVCIPLVSSTGHGHASLNYVHYQNGKFALGSILVALTAINEEELDVQFLHLYLSQLKDVVLVPLMKGAANVSLSVTAIKGIEIPLPSIARQTEIVEKFKRIVVEEQELISELSYQKGLIYKLKQQILQDAIEGKLTATWRVSNSNIGNGNKLLDRVKSNKKNSLGNDITKNKIELLPISDNEKLFELPDTWTWCRLGDIVDEFIGGYAFKSASFLKTGHNQVLRLGNIRPHKIRHNEKAVFVDDKVAKSAEKVKIIRGDLLITMTGTRGKRDYCYTVLVDENHINKRDLYLNQRVGCLRFNKNILPEFYDYSLKVDSLRDQIFSTATGAVNQANIGVKTIKEWIVPLPPLCEQQQIVNKIKDFHSVCDQLESLVDINNANAKELMEAVLKEEFLHDIK